MKVIYQKKSNTSDPKSTANIASSENKISQSKTNANNDTSSTKYPIWKCYKLQIKMM